MPGPVNVLVLLLWRCGAGPVKVLVLVALIVLVTLQCIGYKSCFVGCKWKLFNRFMWKS